MKPGAGKGKGSSFERKIGSQLSLWLSHGERHDLLCRTVGSGGQFTTACGKAGIPGDLRAQAGSVAFQFCDRFVIECKHWRKLDMVQFLQGQGDLYKALEKVKQEAFTTCRSWMLVAKQNNRPTFLFMPQDIECDRYIFPLPIVAHRLFNDTVILFQLDAFLKLVKPEELLNGNR